MKPRGFNTACFAVNRWNVGHQGASAEVMREGLEADEMEGQRRGEIFRENRMRSRLRAKLLAEKPFCDNCGCRLIGDAASPFYANVVADRISCKKCVRIVRALREVETEEDPVIMSGKAGAVLEAQGAIRKRESFLIPMDEWQLLRLAAALRKLPVSDFILACVTPHLAAVRENPRQMADSEVQPC